MLLREDLADQAAIGRRQDPGLSLSSAGLDVVTNQTWRKRVLINARDKGGGNGDW